MYTVTLDNSFPSQPLRLPVDLGKKNSKVSDHPLKASASLSFSPMVANAS